MNRVPIIGMGKNVEISRKFLMGREVFKRLVFLFGNIWKIKRVSNGKKKLIAKKIPVDVDYLKAMDEGLIILENCSNCWEITDDEKQADVMLLHLLCYLFLIYQEEGNIPEYIGYDV